MRLSRHAKNKLRLYDISPDEVSRVISPDSRDGKDRHGNPRYIGEIGGRRFRVVIALDDLMTVITVYDLEE